jgi:DNA polymerase
MSALHPLTALSFLIDAGADEAIELEPMDRLRRLEPPVANSAAPMRTPHRDFADAASPSAMPRPAAQMEPQTQDAAARSARALAEAAPDLDALKAAMIGFNGCALSKTATQLVFADGTPGADLMIIGEAPGRDEDLEGRPFVGRSGQLLDRMLAAIGLSRAQVYIANVVPWRPPGNRKPTAAEAAICRPFLERQIVLSRPKLILLLGGAAVSGVLGREEGIMRLRGQFYDLQVDNLVIPAFATFHPAFLLRASVEKRLAWRDFLALKARLNSL